MKKIILILFAWSLSLTAYTCHRHYEFKKNYKMCMTNARQHVGVRRHKHSVDCKNLFHHNMWLCCMQKIKNQSICMTEAQAAFEKLKK